jgi:hypothetical protein
VSILLLLFAPGIFAIFWLIRMQICLARVRYLVDTYGLSRKKLRPLKCKEVKQLRANLDQLQSDEDVSGLENLARPYRG